MAFNLQEKKLSFEEKRHKANYGIQENMREYEAIISI